MYGGVSCISDMDGEGESATRDCSEISSVLLEETFYDLPKKRSSFKVKLTDCGLILSKNEAKTRIIPLRDIVGCRCFRTKANNNCVCQPSVKIVDESQSDDVTASLYVYAYILSEDRKERQRFTLTLRFRSFNEYEDNLQECRKWRDALKRLLRKENPNGVKENRRLLVLLSPKSGAGNGRSLFQNKIVPILQEAEVAYDLYITKYANYAREFVRECDLLQWSEIVTVGGDGIVYEVINGLMERSDWQEALKKTALGVIPGGSGNGLARSIAFSRLEPFDIPYLPSALSLVRNSRRLMDLVRVETSAEVMFSFLSVGWGFLSDVDIESERLRSLGGQRFTVWAMARLVGLRLYTGKVYYLPVTENLPPKKVEKKEETAVVEAAVDVDLNVLQKGYKGCSYGHLKGSQVRGPSSRLPPLSCPLPPNWKCLSGSFVMVHAAYQTHISSECLLAPDAQLNDGVIWLVAIFATASRIQILEFLLGLATGSHVKSQSDSIRMIPVKAFRIEPNLHEEGYLTVDGELVQYGALQAEICPGLISVMVP